MGESGTAGTKADDTDRAALGDGPIVIGIDGSAEARRGMIFAADLALELDRDLLVVHALGLYNHISGWTTSIDEYEAEAKDLMRTWCEPLEELSGLGWSYRTVRGEPVHTILSVADEADAGLIVLGSHGIGGSLEPLVGSTSQKVLLKSRRPVLVVPPGADHPHSRDRVARPDATQGRAIESTGPDLEPGEMRELDRSECWRLLRTCEFGRLAVPVESGGADIFPVNHLVDGGSIVFRTADGSKLTALTDAEHVAFEADGVDRTPAETAWSVVVKGAAHAITRSDEVLDTFDLDVRPWHEGRKPMFVRLEPVSVTGRRFLVSRRRSPDATADGG